MKRFTSLPPATATGVVESRANVEIGGRGHACNHVVLRFARCACHLFNSLLELRLPPLTVSFALTQKLRINNPKCYYNARGEELLRQSGLTYTIIRVEGFNNLPGGVQAVEVKQVRITKGMD